MGTLQSYTYFIPSPYKVMNRHYLIYGNFSPYLIPNFAQVNYNKLLRWEFSLADH